MSSPIRPAVFFDRDGVLNVDHGYSFRAEDWEWMPGAIEAIRLFNQAGYWVFVVTNQSGIARGFYAESDLEALHGWVRRELASVGAWIDAFYHCPHGPDSTCDCRKPKPGMLHQAMQDFPVDSKSSVLIGDKDSDVTAAHAAGIRGLRFPGGDLAAFVRAFVLNQSDPSEVS